MEDNSIYNLTLEHLLNKDFLNLFIYPNENLNLYWSEDWSEEFYIESAYKGFISTYQNIDGIECLLPEIQHAYAVLDWNDLIIPNKINKIINSLEFKNYAFKLNCNLDNILSKIANYHNNNWVSEKYAELFKKLIACNNKSRDFHVLTAELVDLRTNEIIAGEFGYTIGATYTSLSGFCERTNKKYNNFGKLQLVLLAKTLEYHGYHFWNLGHPYMNYKFELGAKIKNRMLFLDKWIKARDEKPNKVLNLQCEFGYEFYKRNIKI